MKKKRFSEEQITDASTQESTCNHCWIRAHDCPCAGVNCASESGYGVLATRNPIVKKAIAG